MKARIIYPRNALVTYDNFLVGKLYKLIKVNTTKVTEDHFWWNTKVWIRPKNEKVNGIERTLGAGITGIRNDTLYPSIAFDKHFKFIEIPLETLKATQCRFQEVDYKKTFN